MSEPEHEARPGDSALCLGSFLVRQYLPARRVRSARRRADRPASGRRDVHRFIGAEYAREVRLRGKARATPLPRKPPGPARRTALGTVPKSCGPPRTGPCRSASPGSFRQTGPTSKGSLNPATHFAVGITGFSALPVPPFRPERWLRRRGACEALPHLTHGLGRSDVRAHH